MERLVHSKAALACFLDQPCRNFLLRLDGGVARGARWKREIPVNRFDECLYQARTQQLDLLVEQTVDVTHDLVAKPKLDMAQVQAAKLLVENSRWIGSKLQRRLYGDDPQVQVQQQTQVTVPAEVLADLRTRLDAARELVQDRDKDKNSTVCREGARAELEPGPKTSL